MTTAELRIILEHLPDDLPVHIAGRGELVSARRTSPPWSTNGLHLDVRGPMLRGVYRDRRTLDVRLESIAERAAS